MTNSSVDTAGMEFSIRQSADDIKAEMVRIFITGAKTPDGAYKKESEDFRERMKDLFLEAKRQFKSFKVRFMAGLEHPAVVIFCSELLYTIVEDWLRERKIPESVAGLPPAWEAPMAKSAFRERALKRQHEAGKAICRSEPVQ